MSFSISGCPLAGCIIALLLPAAAGVAHDRDDIVRHLQGAYGLTNHSACLRSVPHPASEVGIDPQTGQLLLPAQTIAQTGSGVMRFSRDGRVRFSGRASELDLNGIDAGDVPNIPGLTLTCSGTHTVQQGKLVLLASCTVVAPQIGASFTVPNVEAEGPISDDGSSIELTARAHVQNIQLSLPDGSSLSSERVCTQRWSLVKLP